MPFEIKILGSSSATPTLNRNQSCQVLNIEDHLYLIDCGEGAQIQLLRHKIKSNKIKAIFISHLHGDHYLGLFGLISSMHLQGRTSELNIYGPPGLNDIITLQLRCSETVLSYQVNFIEIDEAPVQIMQDDKVTVTTILMNHRIRCFGYLFVEKEKKRKIIKEKLPKGIKLVDIVKLQNGEDIYDEHQNLLIKNADVTFLPKKIRTYAYCADTKYNETFLAQIAQVDILYHESTFLHEMIDRADKTFHSTALQAASLAKKANVGKLIIGHFSTRYLDLHPLLTEARSVFTNSFLAIEGETFKVD